MAGDAAGTATQGQQDAGQGGEQQGGGPDIGSLSEQLATLSGGMEDMRSFLQSQPWQQEAADDGTPPTGAPEADAFDFSFLDPEAPGFDPEQIASSLQQVVDRAVEQRVQTAIQQQVQPVADKTAEMQREREAEALVHEFPALGDQETAQQLVHVAGQVAEAYNHPELANEPWFWRTIYMAGQAADMASQEGTAPGPAVLEGGGGAMPSGSQEDLASAIVGAKGRGVLPF